MRFRIRVAPLLLALAAGCGEARAPVPEAQASPAPRDRPRILVVGTSLTAGLGLERTGAAYPAVLQRRVEAAGYDYEVVGAGVSGETSAGALSRIDWLLRQPVSILLIETGANDGLRGLDPEAMRANIQALVDRAREQEPAPAVVLLGMRAPTNLGAGYGERFAAVFEELAVADDLALVPFLLEGVGGEAELNQADGIHPNAAGHRRTADNVWKVLEPLLRERALSD